MLPGMSAMILSVLHLAGVAAYPCSKAGRPVQGQGHHRLQSVFSELDQEERTTSNTNVCRAHFTSIGF